MRKITATILSLLTVSALALPTAEAFVAKKTVAEVAEAPQVETIENGLIVPSSYEEYLQLVEPSCVAVCENYTAIADGDDIYLFDRADNEYRKYTHAVNDEISQNAINQMQFDGNENLYFLDGSYLFLIETAKFDEFESASATATSFPCDNFLIDGETLYYVEAKTPAVISKTELKAPNVSTAKNIANTGGKPDLALFGGELYFIDASAQVILYKVNPETPSTLAQVTVLDARVEHMTVCDGVFAYTTPAGELFAYPLSDVTESGLHFSTGADGYSKLAAFGTHIYVTQKDKGVIRQYSTADKDFTSFEICASSSADNRLSGATDAALFGDELFIADDGNKRVSVYNRTEKAFTAHFNADLSPSFIATDGKNLLLASTDTVALYSLASESYGEQVAVFNGFEGVITGAVSVYGVHYIVTEKNYFYAVAENENGEWTRTEVKKTSTHPPQLLAADAYGNLYIKSGTYAYKFTEDSFMQADASGERLLDTLPSDAVKLAIDYECGIYALSDGVYKFVKQADGAYAQEAVDVSERFVYGDAPTLTSLAFGIEDNVSYLLFNGNYIVQTKNLALPTVKNIPVSGADERIFEEAEAEFKVVKTQEKALLVSFDIERLNGAEVFPYLSYERSAEAKTALKIGETDVYNVVAHFDTETSEYSTYLVLKTACEELSADDYLTEYGADEQRSAWLTNGLALYKFPYLCDELVALNELPRGAEVTLLGEIGELDHEYYHIAYADGNGVQKTGYIPKSYATLFDASPKDSDTVAYGSEESDRDALWRLAYLLLGFGAICILVDYLILRKKKDD